MYQDLLQDFSRGVILSLVDMSFLGESLLAVVFLLCSFAAVFSLVALKLETKVAGKVFTWARRAQLTAAGLSVVVLILLTAAFLTDDFSMAVVGQYSSVELPFFYKLSAVWAGSAGSLLLWSVGIFILFGLWLVRAGREPLDSELRDTRFDAAALSIGAGVCLGFSALLTFIAKPFASCPVTIDDGMGLNPLLQNFWMIIHPPLLFVGYSAFLIPFVIVLAGVFIGRANDSGLYRQLRSWLLLGICFLGLGIATGAKWSYVEFGWGGYWAWDPVENASLLPWLVAVAALHSLVGIRVADRFRRWTIVLAPVPFILCLIATFITRSGILASLHSFGQNAMFSALLAFIGCCFALWLICIIRAFKAISIVSYPPKGVFRLDKDRILFWTIIIFVLTAAAVGIATFWPVIWRVFTSSNSGFTLTRSFYDRVISVAGILLAFLVGLVGLADFRKRNGFILRLLVCCLASLLCFELVRRLAGPAPLMSFACGICAFSFVAVLMKLLLNLKGRGRIGGNIAHLGLLLLVVAVGFSSYEQAVQVRLARGEEIMLGRYTIVYDSFERKSVAGVTKVGPEVAVTRDGLTKKLWPHNSLYPGGKKTSEVAVHTGLFRDIYVSFDSVGWDGRVAIAVKLKPLMLWLWFAFLLIAAGPALAMLEKKRKTKSENRRIRF